MAWAVPEYTRNQVDKAGKTIVALNATEEDRTSALRVVNNWRASHGFPLNTFQVRLRRRGRIVDDNCVVAQRIKRLSSIEAKLKRPNINMPLSRMQDIGGCRAVVETVTQVHELVHAYCMGAIKHKLIGFRDYIQKPKQSGYRSTHLVYKYHSDKNSTYNNLQVELQIRTAKQHAWATAVETVDTFTKQSLKSSQGEQDWLRFFAIMGSGIALLEDTPPVPGTLTDLHALRGELRRLTGSLDVRVKLRAFNFALRVADFHPEQDAHYFLLHLNSLDGRVEVFNYKLSELPTAQYHYSEIERDNRPGSDVVLVSVDSLAVLKRAYPNYFADTHAFIELLDQVID